MQIAPGHVARIQYILTGPDGTTLDQSPEGQPLPYLHGHKNIIPGLEAALNGRSAGDQFKVTIPSDQAYGPKNPNLIGVVPRTSFPKDQMITVGQQFQANDPQGHAFMVRVTALTDTEVTVDANHPLAGVDLTFNVTVVDIRVATKEELDHGHVHGPGGHHHG